MSYYYKYNFTSPEIVYSTVKEELKSYFDTGAVDDLMFPTYTDKCLRKLGRATYVISEEVMYIEDFQARLPDNFFAVREAWLCTEVNGYPYRSANSFYSQASSQETIQVSPVTSNGVPCTNPECTTGCPTCMPELIQAVYKTNNEMNISYKKQYLLKPGNISVKANCTLDCANFASSAADSFDIRDNKFVTNFRRGTVYLIFYSTEYDNSGNQLIPDNYRIREYIEAFIKYKVFETLSNQINDETFQQIQAKLAYYKQMSEEAFIMADIEIKKQDVYAKQRRIKNDLNRFNMYELPSEYVRYGAWRRNN
jgi:hypothetical protein